MLSDPVVWFDGLHLTAQKNYNARNRVLTACDGSQWVAVTLSEYNTLPSSDVRVWWTDHDFIVNLSSDVYDGKATVDRGGYTLSQLKDRTPPIGELGTLRDLLVPLELYNQTFHAHPEWGEYSP